MDKFDHIKWSTSNERSGSTAQAKCYNCTFCKRGFSNAQALGGHMNIHRRDRARIRQFSEENQLSSDTIKTPTDHDPSNYPSVQESTSLQLEVAKSSYSFNGKEDKHAIHRGNVAVHHEIQKLPLFFEEPDAASNIDDNLRVTSGCGSYSDHREKRAEKLDLELRLGPDPDRRNKSRFSTQEFFLR